jgi:hypothetical protein
MIVVRNTRGPSPPEAPMRPDGTPYRFEMIFDGFGYRAYADTPAELCEALIEGYRDLPDDRAQYGARIVNAVTHQVQLQAALNAEGDLGACTEAQREILLGPRHLQPQVASWDCVVPLVLVDAYYKPIGQLVRPAGRSAPSPGGYPCLIWLSPATEETYLRSLAQAGVIVLAELKATGHAFA